MSEALTEGLHDVPAERYHGPGLCPWPALSKSTIHTLVERSARHAWVRHPDLNPNFEPEAADKFDFGHACHAALFENERGIAIIEAENWRTKAAKAARDDARSNGRYPILAGDMAEIRAIAAAARAQIRATDLGDILDNGLAEQTLIWGDAGAWCKARIDWLPTGGNVVLDYKTTSASAHAEEFGKKGFFDLACDLQDAWYRRGLDAVLGKRGWQFRFVVQEIKPPYALSILAADPHTQRQADAKIEEALDLWRWCLREKRWPGYTKLTAFVSPPPWHDLRFELRRASNKLLEEDGEDLKRLMIDWQAPLPEHEAAE